MNKIKQFKNNFGSGYILKTLWGRPKFNIYRCYECDAWHFSIGWIPKKYIILYTEFASDEEHGLGNHQVTSIFIDWTIPRDVIADSFKDYIL